MSNLCDYAKYNDNPCQAAPTFEIETREHDRYRVCDDHIALSFKIVASLAPLTVNPIFANWAPVGRPIEKVV